MKRRAALVGAAVSALVGCTTPEPERLADCDGVEDATAREDCRLGFAAALADDREALEAAIETIEDPTSRDLLRLRLAVQDPARAGWLCEGVVTEAAQTRCRQVLGRPHLQTGVRE